MHIVRPIEQALRMHGVKVTAFPDATMALEYLKSIARITTLSYLIFALLRDKSSMDSTDRIARYSSYDTFLTLIR
ncbi:MAG TPA: hypothetical protein VFJ05_03250 [Nitrososphaeraceae archaeon]|nr:hypothetical protein [Nitrososphaeraceae archaeon]